MKIINLFAFANCIMLFFSFLFGAQQAGMRPYPSEIQEEIPLKTEIKEDFNSVVQKNLENTLKSLGIPILNLKNTAVAYQPGNIIDGFQYAMAAIGDIKTIKNTCDLAQKISEKNRKLDPKMLENASLKALNSLITIAESVTTLLRNCKQRVTNFLKRRGGFPISFTKKRSREEILTLSDLLNSIKLGQTMQLNITQLPSNFAITENLKAEATKCENSSKPIMFEMNQLAPLIMQTFK